MSLQLFIIFSSKLYFALKRPWNWNSHTFKFQGTFSLWDNLKKNNRWRKSRGKKFMALLHFHRIKFYVLQMLIPALGLNFCIITWLCLFSKTDFSYGWFHGVGGQQCRHCFFEAFWPTHFSVLLKHFFATFLALLQFLLRILVTSWQRFNKG